MRLRRLAGRHRQYPQKLSESLPYFQRLRLCGSSAGSAAISPNSDAEIRNAVVSDMVFEDVVVNDPLALVNRALDCSDSNTCGAGDCFDRLLGVLYECLEDSDQLTPRRTSLLNAGTYSSEIYPLETSSAARDHVNDLGSGVCRGLT